MARVLRRLLATLLVLAVAGLPAALAGACDEAGTTCCCTAPGETGDRAASRECGCAVDGAENVPPAVPAAPTVDSRAPLASSVPVGGTPLAGALPALDAATRLACAPPSAVRLHLRHGVFRC